VKRKVVKARPQKRGSKLHELQDIEINLGETVSASVPATNSIPKSGSEKEMRELAQAVGLEELSDEEMLFYSVEQPVRPDEPPTEP
jgi:hypothetical protein